VARKKLMDACDRVARGRHRTSRYLPALVRAPAVVSVALLPLMGYGTAHQGQNCHQLSTAAHILTQAAGSAAVSIRQVSGLADGAVELAGLASRSSDPIQIQSQAARVAQRPADASPADRARVETAVAAAGPDQRPYVLKTIAAGHSADEVVTFAQTIRDKKLWWLRTHLSLIEPSGPGRVTYDASRVQQADNTTCGSMSILMARAIADPLYTLYLTTGGSNDPAAAGAAQFQARLATEEHRIHDASNTFWPQRLGSTPAGVSGELNRHADALGTRYDARLIGHARGNPALRDAVTAARNGQPVPVLTGDWLPRHYVLLIGRDGGDLLLYEPTKGTVHQVGEQDFLDGNMRGLQYPHIQAVITPSR
jgi:hypothetical protein